MPNHSREELGGFKHPSQFETKAVRVLSRKQKEASSGMVRGFVGLVIRLVFVLVQRLGLELQHDRLQPGDVLDVLEPGRGLRVDVEVAQLRDPLPLGTCREGCK